MSTIATLKVSRPRDREEVYPTVSLRLYPDLDRAIDNWIKRRPGGRLGRQEAIRQLLVEALARK